MKGVLIAILITICMILATSYSTNMTSHFFLSFAGSNAFSNQWTCASGLNCQGKCEDTSYQRMWNGTSGTKEYSYTFNAPEANRYTCTVKVKTCCFSNYETNEVSDIYINNVKMVSTPDQCCPEACGLSAPSRLYALPKGTGKVHLSWRMVSNFPNLGYNVYRSTTPGGPYTKINSNPVMDQSNYMDTAVTNGNTYYYVVRLVNATGHESRNSNEARVTASDTNDNYYVRFSNVNMQPNANSGELMPGDVDGDGLFEYLITAAWVGEGADRNMYIAMFDDDGKKLWGPVNTWVKWSGEFTWTFWDLDEDGKEELIGLMYEEGSDRLYMVARDGVTGNILKQSPDIPHQTTDNNRLYMTPAFLDGKNPYIILQNGIYKWEKAWTIAYDRNLNMVWTYYRAEWNHYGGSHRIRAADLDGDGKDEVINGGTVLNEDGSIRWQKFMGHQDGLFPADIDSDFPGMEILYAIEQGQEGWSDPVAYVMLVDKDGNILWSNTDFQSGGGCWAANVMNNYPGLECYVVFDTSEGWEYRLYSNKGEVLAGHGFLPPIDWNGDDVADFINLGLDGRWWWTMRADVIGDYREETIAYTYYGEMFIYTNNDMNPNGKKPSPWDDHLYVLDQRWTGYK